MTSSGALDDQLIQRLEFQKAAAAWAEDRIFARVIASTENEVISIHALAQPLRIVEGDGRSLIAFDYGYFLLLRSVCRALFQGGDTQGALISLFQFEIAVQLDLIGLKEEAAGLLRSACELRSRYSVYQSSITYEAFLYERAISICIAHEQAHLLFDEHSEIRDAWINEANSFLHHFDINIEKMFPDPVIWDDIRRAISAFRANSSLVEEIACDLCSIDHAVEEAVSHRPTQAMVYTDGYYLAARLAVLSLYIARIIARTAALMVQEIREGQLGINTADHIAAHLGFMSELRLRFQVLLMKIVSLKVRLNSNSRGAALSKG